MSGDENDESPTASSAAGPSTYCPSWARTRTLLIQNVAEREKCVTEPHVTLKVRSGLHLENHDHQHASGIGEGELTDGNEDHRHDRVACREPAV